jgi:hypothetical protein
MGYFQSLNRMYIYDTKTRYLLTLIHQITSLNLRTKERCYFILQNLVNKGLLESGTYRLATNDQIVSAKISCKYFADDDGPFTNAIGKWFF